MKFRMIILLAGLSIGMAATADIVTLVDAVETSTANLSVPTSSNGNLSFKPCATGCDQIIRVRLTPETRFVLHGVPMDFADFRREFNKMRRASKDYALVSFDTQRNTVTSVEIGE